MFSTQHLGWRRHPVDDVRRAWWGCLWFVVSFVAAFAVGEGLASLLGYSAEDGVQLRPALLAGIPACAVFDLPALLVAHYGRRAVRDGDPRGQVPVWVALALSLAFLIQNLAALAAGALGF
jgi:hypothetical protein